MQLIAATSDIVLSVQSTEQMNDANELCHTSDRNVVVRIDDSLEKNSYKVKMGDYELPARSKDELLSILGFTETFQEVPSDMFDICSALKDVKSDPIAELKSGYRSFAIVFTKKPEDVMALRGIEEVSSIKYFLSSDEKLATSLGVSMPGVFAYNSVDKTAMTLPLSASFEALNAAMTLNAFSKIRPSTVKMLRTIDQPLYYLMDKKENYKKIKADFEPLVKGFSSFGKFIYFAPEEVPTLIKLAKIEDKDYPLLMTLSEEGKFILRNITKDTFVAQVPTIMNKTAEKIIFSSAIPDDNATRSVKVLNSETVKEFLADESVDRMFLVYSPSCHHCKILDPQFTALGKTLQDKNVDIRVGTYNIIENEQLEAVKVDGVPAIFYIRRGSKELVLLPTTARSVEAIADYISKNAVSAVINLEDYKSEAPAKKEHVHGEGCMHDDNTVTEEELNLSDLVDSNDESAENVEKDLETTVNDTKAKETGREVL